MVSAEKKNQGDSQTVAAVVGARGVVVLTGAADRARARVRAHRVLPAAGDLMQAVVDSCNKKKQ